MPLSTCDLCDKYPDAVRVAEPIFHDFGRRKVFSGKIQTIKCHEDNSLVRKKVNESGAGSVLVIDGGGSLRRSLLGDKLTEKAIINGWEGILIYGAIRDIEATCEINIGIKALAPIPLKTEKKGIGEQDVPVRFAGVDFIPGEMIYCDTNGIIVSTETLV